MKTAMITGASRGIGKACALKFAQEGYELVLTCHTNQQLLQNLQQEIMDTYQIPCHIYAGDIGDYEFVTQLFKDLKSKNISVDVLINNAGVAHIGLLSDMSPEEWNRIIQTNLSSVFYCSKQVIPDMVHRQAGAILNVSSVWGLSGASCEVAYSATKGGVHAFTKALAKELAPSHISVNAVACGCIDTDMNACFSPEERQELEEEIPAGRFGTTKEVAETIYSIVTATSYVTGQIIGIEGGWL